MKTIRNLFADKKGATAIEYGLIAALIAVAAITAMSSLGTNLSGTFNTVSSKLTTQSGGGSTGGSTSTGG
ncbi:MULTISPECIES: Flp family type IVb pilin [unclassified Blastomonas]|uniref:Flp family type IVb pilin n=1 Tax=unclassified Blastomonas TaxID=2626550 RepID=UPI0008246907|nr:MULTISPECIES: Flp family type IVb pilin [unclassified Blastomonas]